MTQYTVILAISFACIILLYAVKRMFDIYERQCKWIMISGNERADGIIDARSKKHSKNTNEFEQNKIADAYRRRDEVYMTGEIDDDDMAILGIGA